MSCITATLKSVSGAAPADKAKREATQSSTRNAPAANIESTRVESGLDLLAGADGAANGDDDSDDASDGDDVEEAVDDALDGALGGDGVEEAVDGVSDVSRSAPRSRRSVA